MRGIRLAPGALAVIALSVPVAGMAAGHAVPAHQQTAHQQTVIQQMAYRLDAYQQPAHDRGLGTRRSFNRRAATFVKSFEGTPYLYGGSAPGGFDCSGLTQYVYGRLGRPIARTAEGQFQQFRPVSRAEAWGGDLVFFHSTSDPSSYVYHVGVYEGGQSMVAAPDTGSVVSWQSFAWAGDTVTFGTITH